MEMVEKFFSYRSRKLLTGSGRDSKSVSFDLLKLDRHLPKLDRDSKNVSVDLNDVPTDLPN
jgi:hypothetical protein